MANFRVAGATNCELYVFFCHFEAPTRTCVAGEKYKTMSQPPVMANQLKISRFLCIWSEGRKSNHKWSLKTCDKLGGHHL